jgi:uncharacterized lipoprotein YddW (UPF0748 family)
VSISPPAQDLIIDNLDPGFTILLEVGPEIWETGSFPTPWPTDGSGDYRWARTVGLAASPTHVCEFRPTLPTTSSYEVMIWYVQGGNRATDVPVTIIHDGGSTTVDVNMESGGSNWQSLGIFDFQAGTTGAVEISNQAEGVAETGSVQVIMADAVRFRVPAAPPPPGAPEIRGVWSSRFNWPAGANAAGSQANIVSLMNSIANNNFNAAFFQVRGQMDTLYPSPNEPWSDIVTSPDGADPGWDPMAFAINEAHSRGISFHAYINTHTCQQPVGAPTHAAPGNSLGIPVHQYYLHCDPNNPAAQDWLAFDAAGNPAPFDEYWYVNPGIPEADTWTREQIMYVVDNYDVDGIHFDRVRMTASGYGRNPGAVARWDDPMTGTPNDGPGNPENLGWDDFMRDAITRAMINITGEAWASKPDVVVSSAPLGLWRSDAYPGYPTGFFYGYVRGQDAKAWMNAGAMDFIVPQIYWDDGGSLPDFSDLYADWQAAADAAGRGLVPGSNNSNGQAEVENHALIARSGGALGHNLWSSGSTNFSSWSGVADPYEVPAAVPDFPWRSTEGVIVVRVYQSDGTTPVTDAWVNRTGSSFTALSSADGLCAFLRVAPGSYTVNASHPAHGTGEASGVTVSAGLATEIDIILTTVPVGISLMGQE